ncbi:hypothetical protein M6D93_12170 [Jatrophihabitans telluris]|uniref:Chloride channel protein n=1 Tax=Jatrophihabitans telluris TaxID=2038343 RepID=A0ABY4QW59_9ACTN|nr:hypothetical protein [Jatrophihabitans telluris]UQX87061.1 hypothetical protein M6D93_12170 [Jatrophihabitans telluris]
MPISLSRLKQLRSERVGLLSLAVLVGVGAGLGAVVFRYISDGLTRGFTGYPDYAGHGHAGNPHLPALGPWFVLLTPALPGVLYGPLVYRFAAKHRATAYPRSWSR